MKESPEVYAPPSWEFSCMLDDKYRELKDFREWVKFCRPLISKNRFDNMADSRESPGL